MELEAISSTGSSPRTGRGLHPLGVRSGRRRDWLRPSIVLTILLSAGSAPLACLGATPSTDGPPTRHVVVVENSANMKAQREQTADLISRMLLNGFHGRIRTGEVVELWVVDSDVATNALPAFRWHPVTAIDDSNSAYRYLRSLKSSAKRVPLNDIFARLDLANPSIPRLLVYVASSGRELLRATPFDDRVNPIFEEHAERLAKQGQPFVTVLAAQEGEWVAHSVTPGDRHPYIPAFPPMELKPEPAPEQTPTNTAAPPAVVPEPPSEVPSGPSTNQPEPMTVDEIAAKMREMDMARALTSAPPASVSATHQPQATLDSPAIPAPSPIPAPAPTPAPLTNGVLATPTAPPPELVSSNLVSPTAGAPLDAPLGGVRMPVASAMNAPDLTPEVASPAAPRPETASGLAPTPELELEAASEPEPVPDPEPAPAKPSVDLAKAERPSPHPKPPLGERSPTLSPWKDLLVGTTLLTAAGALAVLLIRQVTHRPRASLISQSLGSTPGASDSHPGRKP